MTSVLEVLLAFVVGAAILTLMGVIGYKTVAWIEPPEDMEDRIACAFFGFVAWFVFIFVAFLSIALGSWVLCGLGVIPCPQDCGEPVDGEAVACGTHESPPT